MDPVQEISAEKPMAKAKATKVKKASDLDPTSKLSAETSQIEKSAEVKAADLAIQKGKILKKRAETSLRNRTDSEDGGQVESSSSSASRPTKIGKRASLEIVDSDDETEEVEVSSDVEMAVETDLEKGQSSVAEKSFNIQSLSTRVREIFREKLGVDNDDDLQRLLLDPSLLSDALNGIVWLPPSPHQAEHFTMSCSIPFESGKTPYEVVAGSPSFYRDSRESEERGGGEEGEEGEVLETFQNSTVNDVSTQSVKASSSSRQDRRAICPVVQAQADHHTAKFADLFQNLPSEIHSQNDRRLSDLDERSGEEEVKTDSKTTFINLQNIPALHFKNTIGRNELISVQDHIANCFVSDVPYSKFKIFGEASRYQISVKLVQAKVLSEENRDAWLNIPPEKDEEFFKRLLCLFPAFGGTVDTALKLQNFEKISFGLYKPEDENSISRYTLLVRKGYEDLEKGLQTPKNFHKIVKACGRSMRRFSETGIYFAEMLESDPLPNNPLNFDLRLLQMAVDLKEVIVAFERSGLGGHPVHAAKISNTPFVGKSGKKSDNKKRAAPSDDNYAPRAQPEKAASSASASNGSAVYCDGCGQLNHSKANCGWKHHPDFNKSNRSWNESDAYKSLKEKGARLHLVGTHRVSGDSLNPPLNWKREGGYQEGSSSSGNHRPAGGDQKRFKTGHTGPRGEQCLYPVLDSLSLAEKCHEEPDYFTIPVNVLVDKTIFNVNLLIDTGCLQANFVSRVLAHQLLAARSERTASGGDLVGGRSKVRSGEELRWECKSVDGVCTCPFCSTLSCNSKSLCTCDNEDNLSVCTALKQCAKTTGCLSFVISIFDEINKAFKDIRLTFYILNDLSYDLIIGLKDIRKYDIFGLCPSFLLDDYPVAVKMRRVLEDSEPCMPHSLKMCAINEQRVAVKMRLLKYAFVDTKLGMQTVLNSLCKEGNFVEFPEEGSFHEAECEQTDEIQVDDTDIFYESTSKASDSSINLLPVIATGDEEFDRLLEEACLEFSDVFSTELRKEPADIPPMKIEVKHFDDLVDRWDVPRNRAPARMQSTGKQNDLRQQIKAMLDRNVIKPSDATAYSQVIMIPKTDKSWRFCVDYRYLNELCVQPRWPIPNIRMMLNRIGARKAMFYGLIDMTKGYYQAPLVGSGRLS
jgi:hypothetical protein